MLAAARVREATMTSDALVEARPPGRRTFFGHPRALSTLFLTEMWERFSFYGMRAIVGLYLTAAVPDNGLGVADRLLGARRGVLWGGVVIAAGHYVTTCATGTPRAATPASLPPSA
jgi:POT family proton-dependent oligopeptide transporter